MYLSQPLIDLSALNDARASALNEQAEKYGVRTARDLVVLVAVNLYLEAVATGSRVEMTRAQLATGEALFEQARDLKAAGVVAGIDVLRSQVQLQNERQRVIAAENDSDKAKLQLARAIGLPLGQVFTLTDRIPYAPMPAPPLDEVLARALDSRPDFLAAKSRVEAAAGGQPRGNGDAPAIAAIRRRLRRHRPDLRRGARHVPFGGHDSHPDLRRRHHDGTAYRNRIDGPAA